MIFDTNALTKVFLEEPELILKNLNHWGQNFIHFGLSRRFIMWPEFDPLAMRNQVVFFSSVSKRYFQFFIFWHVIDRLQTPLKLDQNVDQVK